MGDGLRCPGQPTMLVHASSFDDAVHLAKELRSGARARSSKKIR